VAIINNRNQLFHGINYTILALLFLVFTRIDCVGLVPHDLQGAGSMDLSIKPDTQEKTESSIGILPPEVLVRIMGFLLCDLTQSKDTTQTLTEKTETTTVQTLTQSIKNLEPFILLKNKQIADCIIQALYEKYKDIGCSKPFLVAMMSHIHLMLYWLDHYIKDTADREKLKNEINQIVPSIGVNALILAVAQNGKYATTKFLEAQADPDARETENGDTSLMLAMRGGYEPMARLLLNYKSDIDAKNEKEEQTALHLAIFGAGMNSEMKEKEKFLKLVRLLLEKEADPDKKDKDGNLPLSYAIEHDLPEAAQELIKYNANVNKPMGRRGSSMPLLHYIALRDVDQKKKLGWLKLFEDSKKLKIDIKDRCSHTALWYAKKTEGNEHVIDWLEKRINDNNNYPSNT
jgi:ankyrin repeat protein